MIKKLPKKWIIYGFPTQDDCPHSDIKCCTDENCIGTVQQMKQHHLFVVNIICLNYLLTRKKNAQTVKRWVPLKVSP